MADDVREQVASLVRAVELEHPSITVDELTRLRAGHRDAGRRPTPKRWPIVLTSAAVFLALVAGIVLLSPSPPTPAPVATLPPPPTDEDIPSPPPTEPPQTPTATLAVAAGNVQRQSQPATVSPDLEPLGTASIRTSVADFSFLPHGLVHTRVGESTSNAFGGIVETSTGYTALGFSSDRRKALASSTDGVTWTIIDTGDDLMGTGGIDDLAGGFGDPGRLFEAGGWYWIGLNKPRLYRSADTLNWERIDLDGRSPGPMGVPLRDQRWHEFDDKLVAASSELIVVDTATAEVEFHDRPWSLPPDGGWWWMTDIDGTLTAFVSSAPERPDRAALPVIEQFETADLITWTGPTRPVLATDDTTGLLIHGDTHTGLVASTAGPDAGGYFSEDGFDWRQVALADWSPDRLFSLPARVVPVRVAGAQALVHQTRARVLHISTDGVAWQELVLPDPADGGSSATRFSGSSLSLLGSTIWYYEARTHDDGDELWSWAISFDE